MTDTLFFLLGALDEYGGRAIVENGDVVERFYGSERAVAALFLERLSDLAHEHGIDPTVAVELEPDTGATVYRSPALTALLDACYDVDFSSSGYVTTGAEARRCAAFISIEVFKDATIAARESFLCGAYVRFGSDTAYRLPNAKHKAHLISDILIEMGCADTRVIVANPGHLPEIFEVRFTPTQRLAHLLSLAGRS